jgi:hypothetical protein
MSWQQDKGDIIKDVMRNVLPTGRAEVDCAELAPTAIPSEF